MKKLLALILCVMMFVAIIPTAAFAVYDTTDQRVWAGAGQTNQIVEALRTNINNMYGSIAVDNAVFNSVKQIDTIIKDLVDGALKDYGTSPWAVANGSLTSASTLNDAIVAGLRSTIGGQITDYLDKHQGEYYTYDTRGNKIFNPTKYAGVYAKAASEALTSSKAVAGIQAYMLYAMSRSVANNIANQAHDLQSSINGWDHWADYGFGDMERGILTWHVPGSDADGINDLDGVLHNVGSSYASVLSALGQLGVDLNDDGIFNLGFDGWVTNVDGGLSESSAATDERVNSALITRYFYDNDNRTVVDDIDEANRLVTVYEDANGVLTAADDYNWAVITDNQDGTYTINPVGVDAYSNDHWEGIWH
jgi:hypothetical protein